MSFEFDVSLAGDFTIDPAVITPGTVSPQRAEAVVMSLTSFARPDLQVASPATPYRPLRPDHALPVRTVASIVHTLPTPALLADRPYQPWVLGQVQVSGSATTGPGHLRAFPDPDPVWGGSSWTTPPPDAPAGAHFMRWTARQLPDPLGFPFARYLLGTPAAEDGTSGFPSGAQQWSASPGSDFDIPWNSAYPFKPTVQSHVHYGEDGAIHTVDRAVHIDPHRVAHMWADFGTVLTPPFTMLLVGVVLAMPGRNWRHYVFDAGYDRTPDLSDAQKHAIWRMGGDQPIKVGESEGYRNGLQVERHMLRGFNDENPTTRIAHVPYRHQLRPKMLAMVVDGANSRFGYWDALGAAHHRITLAGHGAQRLWLLGRINGRIWSLRSSALAIFEIRAWDKALTLDHLQAQFDQLASTWRFDAYERQIRNQLRSDR